MVKTSSEKSLKSNKMKFTIRPTGGFGLVERGLAKVYRDNPEGGREEVSDYHSTMLPGGGRSHRVFWDEKNRVYPIDLSKDQLNRIAKEMRLLDKTTKKLIESADARNEYDPFFCHENLFLEVPNEGISMDSDNAEGEYWLAAIKSEPKLFNLNNNTDNPLVKKVQEFKVITAGHSDVEIKASLKEGRRATEIYHANKDDYAWLKDIARGLDIILGDNPDIELLRDQIFLKITTEKDFKTRDGVRFIDKFLALTDMSQNERATRAKVTEAIGLHIIVREGRKYSFEDEVIGSTPEKVYEFLSREENADIKGKILARIAEKAAKA